VTVLDVKILFEESRDSFFLIRNPDDHVTVNSEMFKGSRDRVFQFELRFF